MSFGEAIKSVFSKYATFSGRARRSEYWYFYLFYFLVDLALGCIPFLSALSVVWWLAVLIPSLAVTVRRFHDIGKSGWNYLIIVIPELTLMGYLFYNIINVIKEMVDAGFKYYNRADSVRAFLDRIMTNSSFLSTLGVLIFIDLVVTILWLVWMTRDSQPGENEWGPNPKEVPSESNSGMNY
jgi:uncharacterized membrane protein YhaH (DUF805 family)